MSQPAAPSILLIRHGMPNIRSSRSCDAEAFLNWRRRYDEVDLHPASRPPATLLQQLASVDEVVTSELKRAHQSVERLGGPYQVLRTADLNETPLPALNIPFLKTSTDQWVALARTAQVAGFTVGTEPLSQARVRARRVAEHVVGRVRQGGRIAVLGHGTINRFVAAEILAMGWAQTARSGREFWRWQLFAPSQPSNRGT